MLEIAPSTGAIPSRPVDHDVAALGRALVDAIVDGDFIRLQAIFVPDVRFRAITPRRFWEASTALDARAIVEDWFGGTESREVLRWTLEPVGDRVAIGYRLALTEEGERRVVEQHVVAMVDRAAFRDLALVCSGFRPLAADPHGAGGPLGTGASEAAGAPEEDSAADPQPFTPAARLDATGLSCATLTPTISATVRELEFGAVLEIVTDDPGAEDDLRAWTRLTGNELVSAGAGPGQAHRFGIRRTPRRAAPPSRKGTA